MHLATTSRDVLPKQFFMSPEQHIAQAMLIFYVALVALAPFSSSAIHISVVVSLCVSALLLPLLHRTLELRGRLVVMVNSFVMFLLGLALLCSPFFVPGALLEDISHAIASNTTTTTTLLIPVCSGNASNLENTTNEGCSSNGSSLLTAASGAVPHHVNVTTSTVQLVALVIENAPIGDQKIWRKSSFRSTIGARLPPGSEIPSSVSHTITFVFFMFVFYFNIPFRWAGVAATPVVVTSFVLFQHQQLPGILAPCFWLLVIVQKKLLRLVLGRCMPLSSASSFTFPKRTRSKSQNRSTTPNDPTLVAIPRTLSYVAGPRSPSQPYNRTPYSYGQLQVLAASPPSAGAQEVTAQEPLNATGGFFFAPNYVPQLSGPQSPVPVPYIVVDEFCVVTEVSDAFTDLSHLERCFVVDRSLISLLEWLNTELLDEVMRVVEMFASDESVAGEQTTPSDALGESGGGGSRGVPKRLLLRCNGVEGADAAVVGKYTPRERVDSVSRDRRSMHGTSPVTPHHRTFPRGVDTSQSTFGGRETPNGARTAGDANEPVACRYSSPQPAPLLAGRIAIILDCWRESPHHIVLQQPVAHAILQAMPLSLALLLPDGTVALWNAALEHVTGLGSYQMIGQNAFTELLGSPDKPMMKPHGFPFHGEMLISVEGKGSRSFACTIMEWRECEGLGVPPPGPGDACMLCYIDRKRSLGPKSGSSHLLSALGRLVNDFNESKGAHSAGAGGASGGAAGQHVKRMTIFCEAVLSLVGQMAAIEVQEQLYDESGAMRADADALGGDSDEQSDGATPRGQRGVDAGRGDFSDSDVVGHALTRTSSDGGGGSGGLKGRVKVPPLAFRGRLSRVSSSVGRAHGGDGTLRRAASAGGGCTGANSAAGGAAGAWARLISADEATFPSCVIATSMNADFKAGRSANCTYKMLNSYVSGVQFSISRKTGGGTKEPTILLTDHSVNGTFVNVRVVGKGNSVVLQHGDLINFRLSNGQFFMGFVFQHIGVGGGGAAHGGMDSARGHGEREGLIVPMTPNANSSAVSPLAGSRGAHQPGGSGTASRQQRAIRWRIGEEMLGKGGNAEVFLGMNLTNGKLMAVKRVPMPRDQKTLKHYVALQDEINLLSVAVHPNIVQYYGSSQSDTHLNILLEFVPGGSLRHLLDNFGPLSDAIILRYLKQILGGLAYLHELDIVHADVKCSNVLVTDRGQCKLTDFGTAKLIGGSKAAKQQREGDANSVRIVGTLLWMAPELVRGQSASTAASDVWSLGCAILEMMSAEAPWSEYDFESEEQIINLLKYTNEPPEIPSTSNTLLHSIVFECLKLDAAERPSCQQLLEMITANERQRRRSSLITAPASRSKAPAGPATQRIEAGALTAEQQQQQQQQQQQSQPLVLPRVPKPDSTVAVSTVGNRRGRAETLLPPPAAQRRSVTPVAGLGPPPAPVGGATASPRTASRSGSATRTRTNTPNRGASAKLVAEVAKARQSVAGGL